MKDKFAGNRNFSTEVNRGKVSRAGLIGELNPDDSQYNINLVFPYFVSQNEERQRELDECLDRNLRNRYISKIILVSREGIVPQRALESGKGIWVPDLSDTTPTYLDLVRAGNRFGDNTTITLIANTDIYFDEDIIKLNLLNWNKVAIALTRWDIQDDDSVKHRGRPDSQDVWGWVGMMPELPSFKEINIGYAGCDNRFAYELSMYYTVINPSYDIKSYHLHKTQHRIYKENNWRVERPYKIVDPVALKDAANKNLGAQILHIGINLRYQQSLYNALRSISPKVVPFDWRESYQEHGDAERMRRTIIDIAREAKPNFIFFQAQAQGLFDREFADKVIAAAGSDTQLVNWCGDVRQPTPNWYVDFGRANGVTTIFTNEEDVALLRSRKCDAEFSYMGFEERIYNPYLYKQNYIFDIAFIGNLYDKEGFDLTDLRKVMASNVYKKFGDRFVVYGNKKWAAYPFYEGSVKPQKESEIYRSVPIIIGMNNVTRTRYTSGRLQRTMGSGAFYLAHNYDKLDYDFGIGRHLAVWEDVEDLLKQLKHYLENPKERKKIARQGMEHVWLNYNWRYLINNLYNKLNNQ